MAVANRKSSFLFLIIIAVVVLFPLTRIDCHDNIHKEVAVFVFGDSLFDPGNNNYINTIPFFQANYLPYGESYFSPPTGRFSDGRLISDFIGKQYDNIIFSLVFLICIITPYYISMPFDMMQLSMQDYLSFRRI